ncbi:MAG: phosphatase PAP2 family protein [Kofleriaceae bacterium]
MDARRPTGLVTVAAVVLLALAGTARAEPWYRGRYGRNRVIHLSITTAGAILYFSSETFGKKYLGGLDCRWCVPDRLDASARNALVWHDVGTANTLSNLTGYVAAPILSLGLVLIGQGSARGSLEWGQVMDDVVPILETVVASELALVVAKFAVERARPFVYYGGHATDPEDNLSFMSGHAELTFALATSAGLIAHRQHYWTEPYIWAGGMTLAAATGYLRIAADKHYLTDVVGGSLVGVAAALIVPRWMERRETTVVPTGNGLAIIGAF